MSKLLRVSGIAAILAILLCAAATVMSARLSAFDPNADLVVAGSVAINPAVRAVQHPTSGIVTEIRRREGDRVKSGELLARLDDSAIRTKLLLSTTSLDQMLARKARLEAERDGKSEISFPRILSDRMGDASVLGAVDDERKTFASRARVKQAEADLHRLRVELLQDEINGLVVQEKAKEAELSLIVRELDGVRQLHGKNLAPLPRLTTLERDAARLEGEQRGAIPVSIAQARSRIADARLQAVRDERDSLRDIWVELRDIDEKLRSLMRSKLEFEAQLKESEILAPQDGIVLSSAIRDTGCAVTPGKDLMLIAPSVDRPSVEAKVDAPSANRLRVGQSAKLVFASGDDAARELPGLLEEISPAALGHSSQGAAYVTLRFVLAPDVKTDHAALAPGASVKVSIPGAQERRALLHRIEHALL